MSEVPVGSGGLCAGCVAPGGTEEPINKHDEHGGGGREKAREPDTGSGGSRTGSARHDCRTTGAFSRHSGLRAKSCGGTGVSGDLPTGAVTSAHGGAAVQPGGKTAGRAGGGGDFQTGPGVLGNHRGRTSVQHPDRDDGGGSIRSELQCRHDTDFGGGVSSHTAVAGAKLCSGRGIDGGVGRE